MNSIKQINFTQDVFFNIGDQDFVCLKQFPRIAPGNIACQVFDYLQSSIGNCCYLSDVDIPILEWEDAIKFDKIAIGIQLAIGDALMFTPTLRQLKKNYPDKKFCIVTDPGTAGVFFGNELAPVYAFPYAACWERPAPTLCPEYVFCPMNHGLLNSIDPNEDGTDVIARQFGVTLEDHSLICNPDQVLVEYYRAWLDGEKSLESGNKIYKLRWDKKPLIIWQMVPSSMIRTYSPHKLLEASEIVAKTGLANCLMVGNVSDMKFFIETNRIDGMDVNELKIGNHVTEMVCGLTQTIKDFVALMSLADVIVSCDSASVHLGSAFKIPTIGIFNMMPPNTRVKYHPTITVLEADDLPCKPCWKDWNYPCKNPDEFGFGSCYKGITPELIAESVLKKITS